MNELLLAAFETVTKHPDIEVYSNNEIPLNRDVFLYSEEWFPQYAKMLSGFLDGKHEYEYIGFISYAAVRKIEEQHIIISFYANTSDRFHEVRLTLPKSDIICCVGARTCDEKPRIIVKLDWLKKIHDHSYSIFCMIDAANMKTALKKNLITKNALIELRNKIDIIAEKYPQVSFISFADSLLIKSNWTVGRFNTGVSYQYEPEIFFSVFKEIKLAFFETIDLSIYGIFCQGENAYYDEPLLHISTSNNHICLNSLGTPFAQLAAIESAARSSIRNKIHAPSELYLDEHFLHSIKTKYHYDKNKLPSYPYKFSDGTNDNYYAAIGLEEITDAITDIKS